MYHWFLLLNSPHDASARHTPGAALKFFNHGSPLTASLNSSERRRLFWLGALEFIPALSGGIAAYHVESGPLRGCLVVAGLILCALVCWLLRHKTPLTRIYSSKRFTNDDKSRNA